MKQHLDQLRLLEQLPQPLHTAFLQLRAAQEAFGLPADISIAGAQSPARHNAEGKVALHTAYGIGKTFC